MATENPTRLAVLIDADNATASLAKELLEEIATFGTPTIKRAYGDWTTQNLAGWKEELLQRDDGLWVRLRAHRARARSST